MIFYFQFQVDKLSHFNFTRSVDDSLILIVFKHLNFNYDNIPKYNNKKGCIFCENVTESVS